MCDTRQQLVPVASITSVVEKNDCLHFIDIGEREEETGHN